MRSFRNFTPEALTQHERIVLATTYALHFPRKWPMNRF